MRYDAHSGDNDLALTPIDRTVDRSWYLQAADQLRAHIVAGRPAPGNRLPSELELLHRFDASRQTVRRALEVLRQEGLVEPVKGVGVFVRADRTTPVLYLRPQDRFKRVHRDAGDSALHADARDQRVDIEQTVHAVGEVRADPQVAACLAIGAGTPVLVRRRLISVRRRTSPSEAYRRAQLADSYFPMAVAERVPRLRDRNTGPGGTYARLEDQGLVLSHFDEQVTFRMPNDEEARWLRIGPGTPVIDLIRVAHTGSGPVECFVSVMAGDKYGLEHRIALDGSQE